MNDDVLVTDGGEAVATEIADAFGKPRRIRLKLQIAPLFQNKLPRFVEAEQPLNDKRLPVTHIEMIDDELP